MALNKQQKLGIDMRISMFLKRDQELRDPETEDLILDSKLLGDTVESLIPSLDPEADHTDEGLMCERFTEESEKL